MRLNISWWVCVEFGHIFFLDNNYIDVMNIKTINHSSIITAYEATVYTSQYKAKCNKNHPVWCSDSFFRLFTTKNRLHTTVLLSGYSFWERIGGYFHGSFYVMIGNWALQQMWSNKWIWWETGKTATDGCCVVCNMVWKAILFHRLANVDYIG